MFKQKYNNNIVTRVIMSSITTSCAEAKSKLICRKLKRPCLYTVQSQNPEIQLMDYRIYAIHGLLIYIVLKRLYFIQLNIYQFLMSSLMMKLMLDFN